MVKYIRDSKASAYNTVNEQSILRYIEEYIDDINELKGYVLENGAGRNTLKKIAEHLSEAANLMEEAQKGSYGYSRR